MFADEVVQIVTQWLDEQDLHGFTYTLSEPEHKSVKRKRRDRFRDEWTVYVFWRDSQGKVFPEPGIVIVDSLTGRPRSIMGL